jgi:FkbM family methyltransferase
MKDVADSCKVLHKVSELGFDAATYNSVKPVSVDNVPIPAQYEPFGLEVPPQANRTRTTGYTVSTIYTPSDTKDSQPADVLPDDYQFNSEIHEQKLVRRTVKAGMTVFDVGAHLGKYTKLFSLLAGDNGRVYAFEPTERSFKKLASAVSQYNCTNVMIINKAVYSENRNIILNEFPEEYSSWNSIGLPKMKNIQDPTITVPIEISTNVEAVTLDSFCQQHNINKIDYLKLDVEGAELEALIGASGLLENKAVCFLQFEISKPMLDGLNSKAKFIFDFLKAKGYECHTINEDGAVGCITSDSDSSYENYIALPSKPLFAESISNTENTAREEGHKGRNTMSGIIDNSKPLPDTIGPKYNIPTNNSAALTTTRTSTNSTERPMYGSFTDGDLWTPQTYMQRAIKDWLNRTSFEVRIALSIDKNPPLDVIITQRWPNITIHRATYPEFDAQDLSKIAGNQYDLVYSNQILEHIPKPWIAAAEMVRVLRPGGLGLHTTCAFNPRHGLPEFNDYSRFLPDGLAELFEGVKVLVKAGWGNRQALLYNLAIDDGHGVLGGRRFCEHLGQKNDEQYPWHVWIIFEKL